MNVAFFLIPKSDVSWIPLSSTLERALRALDESGYTALPLLDDDGHYRGTLTEGDLLRALMRRDAMTPELIAHMSLEQVHLRVSVQPVGIDAQVEELFSRAIEQNFVPVTDSRKVFVGIVRRREILEFCANVFHRAAPERPPE